MARKDPYSNEPDPLTIIDPDSLNVDALAKHSLSAPWGEWPRIALASTIISIVTLALSFVEHVTSPLAVAFFLCLPFLMAHQYHQRPILKVGVVLLVQLIAVVVIGIALRQTHLYLAQLGYLPPLSHERLLTLLVAIPYYIAILWLTALAVRFCLQAFGQDSSVFKLPLHQNKAKVFWSLMLILSPLIAGTLLIAYARIVFYGFGLSLTMQYGLAHVVALPLAGYVGCCFAPYMENLAQQLQNLKTRADVMAAQQAVDEKEENI